MASNSAGGSKYFRWSPIKRQNPNQLDDFSRGAEFGNTLSKAFTGIQGAIKDYKQNKVANQLLAQNYPDQPGGTDPDPDPIDPDTGDPITDPNQPIPDVQLPAVKGNFQGGVAELTLRQEAAKNALDTAYKQAQLEEIQKKTGLLGVKKPGTGGLNLGGGSAEVWTSGGGGGSGDGGYDGDGNPIDNTGDGNNTDSSGNTLRVANPDLTLKNFKNDYGGDSLNALVTGKAVANAQGDYEYTAKDGSKVTIPGSDAKKALNARDINKVRHGFTPPPPSRGANINSTAKPGTLENPAVVESDEEIAALPTYSYYQKAGGPVLQKPAFKRRPQSQ
jgi:hypothetical protein